MATKTPARVSNSVQIRTMLKALQQRQHITPELHALGVANPCTCASVLTRQGHHITRRRIGVDDASGGWRLVTVFTLVKGYHNA